MCIRDRLGNGTKGDGTSQYSPVQVVGVSGTSDSVLKNIVAVAAGDTHAVAPVSYTHLCCGEKRNVLIRIIYR